MKVLITGASGLVGAECVEVLPRAGIELITVGRAPVAGLPHVYWDLRDPLADGALPAQIDAVVHLAKSSRIREIPGAAEEVVAVDLGAGVALATAAALSGASRFVYASSGAVAGYSAMDPASPLTFYASVKRSSELLLANLMPTVSLRLYFPFSARRRCLVRTLAERVAAGVPIGLGAGDGVRLNPVATRDVADAVAMALTHAPATIDVAGAEVVSLRDLATRIGARIGVDAAFVPDPNAGRDAPIGDAAQTTRLLGRAPQPLDEALDELTAGLRVHDEA